VRASCSIVARPRDVGQGFARAEPEPHEPAEDPEDEELEKDDHRDADGKLLGDAEAAEEEIMQLLAEADTVDRERRDRDSRIAS